MPRFIVKPFILIYRFFKRWLRVRREYRITLVGVIFVVITFFIGFAAINTNTNLLYLIMSVMLSLFILSGILSTNTLRKIGVTRLAARHISALEEASVQLEIKNNKRLSASYSLRVMDYLVSGQLAGVSYLFQIKPGSRKILSYTIKFPKRGLYKLETIRIATRFPFGFFERALIIKQPQEILVYPQIVEVQPILEGARLDLGDYETGRKGHGHSLYGIREYTPTDSARFIHWKVSARSSKIMVREFEKEEKKKITLFLNNAIKPGAPPSCIEAFEQAVVYCASIAKYLIDRAYQVQLITGSGRVPFGLGITHLHRIMRALAIIELEEKEKEGKPSLPLPDADSTNVAIHFDSRISPEWKKDQAQIIDIQAIRKSMGKSQFKMQNKK